MTRSRWGDLTEIVGAYIVLFIVVILFTLFALLLNLIALAFEGERDRRKPVV